MTESSQQAMFSLLPRPEGRTRSFVTSSVVNVVLLSAAIVAGMSAQRVIEQHYEQTVLIVPTQPPPPAPRVRPPRLPEPPKPKMQAPRIERPKIEEPKPVQLQARVTAPPLPQMKPHIAMAPQPKPALVHFGDPYGVTPNPNALRPATVAAIGDPNGGMNGAAVAPRGVVRSTGIGDSPRPGAGAGGAGSGRVAAVGMPGATPVTAMPVMAASAQPESTNVEVLSKPPVAYTAEARQLRIQGNVVLSVTFLSSGHVVVRGVIHGLGHGLDEEAIRVAQQIHFRPATLNGRPVDVTTRVTISFQLA